MQGGLPLLAWVGHLTQVLGTGPVHGNDWPLTPQANGQDLEVLLGSALASGLVDIARVD